MLSLIMEENLIFMCLKQKSKKIVIMIVLLFFLILIILAFMPIKMSVSSEDDIEYSSYFIYYIVPEGSTDAGCVICYDQDGKHYNKMNVEGDLPQNILSKDICESGTAFLLYGSLTVYEDEYTLDVSDWDVFGNVNRNCDSLRLDLKKYITILDFKCFDFLLFDKWFDD